MSWMNLHVDILETFSEAQRIYWFWYPPVPPLDAWYRNWRERRNATECEMRARLRLVPEKRAKRLEQKRLSDAKRRTMRRGGIPLCVECRCEIPIRPGRIPARCVSCKQ